MELQQTLLAFLIGCMGARLLLVYFVKQLNKKWLSVAGYLAIFPIVVILYIFLTGVRNNLGALGEKIWWNGLRPVHAILYALFAYFAIQGKRYAWMYLFADTMVSLVGFVWVHSSNGDFSKAFL